MLLVSERTFSLSVAVYNTRRLRDELIGQLTGEFPVVAIVKLPPQSTDPFLVVARKLTVTNKPRAIFVLDLEESLPLQGEPSSALRSLNASRELWERFACPVVFWLAEHAAARVAMQAVDFWRYRSHTFEFTAPTREAGEWRSESFPGYDVIAGLPYDEKRFRRAELEQRLAEAGISPPESMLPHVLLWMYELAVLHEVFGSYDASEKLKRDAVRKCEQKYGVNAPETAIAINNLATLLQDTNRLTEAEPLMRRALSIGEQSHGAKDPRVAVYLNNLAHVFEDTNRVMEAEPLVRRALAIDEQFYGTEHPDVARDLNNLALLLKETNRLPEAEPLMRRALATDEQSFGAEHPNVAIRLNNLALLLKATNRLAEAEPLLRRALAIDEQSYGTEHPNVAADLNNLARLLQATNRLAEAEPMMRRCVQIMEHFRASAGHSHPKSHRRNVNYRLLLTEMGVEEAEIDARLAAALESAQIDTIADTP
jgi:tetratricopeptide (TPR) repeat protein